MYISKNEFLEKCNIEKMIINNCSLNSITNTLKKKVIKENLTIKLYNNNVHDFIKNNLHYTRNRNYTNNKKDKNIKYWVKYEKVNNTIENQLSFFDFQNTITNSLINNNESIFNPDDLNIKPITKESYVHDIIKFFESETQTVSVALNSKIFESIKDLLYEQYNIKNDTSKIINVALLLLLLKKDS